MDRAARNVIAALVVGGVCGVGGAVLVRSRARQASGSAPEPAMSATDAVAEPPTDWCAAGFDAIEGGGCLAVPSATPARSLIVYLHGRYARDAADDEVDRQRRLAARARAHGEAVLAMRGRLGGCTAPELATWFCWPSNERNADAGGGVVASWSRALSAAQALTGGRRRFVLGFSNGGYFAGLIASQGWLDVDAIVIAHGGPVEPLVPVRRMPPMLLLSADDDVAQDEMIRLDEDLAQAHWPHDSYARTGTHGLTDGDIDAALDFFARFAEPLPLHPELPLHRAVRHAREAGPDTSAAPDQPTPDEASAPTDEPTEDD